MFVYVNFHLLFVKKKKKRLVNRNGRLPVWKGPASLDFLTVYVINFVDLDVRLRIIGLQGCVSKRNCKMALSKDKMMYVWSRSVDIILALSE